MKYQCARYQALIRRPSTRCTEDFAANIACILARQKDEQLANSTGCAGRLKTVFSPNFSTFSRGIVDGIRGVHTGPGATAFTRMPCSIASLATDLVIFGWMLCSK